MKLQTSTLCLFLAVTLSLSAQQPDKQYWSWFFGNQVSINFTSSTLPPVPVAGSAMSANEGASAISDTNGNVLFYSNGQSVWNSQHQLLPNGTGLKGHYWSSQSALIVKMPDNDSLYYIFTVNNWTDNLTELNYSVINKNLDNGFGAVTSQKNILFNSNCSEHLTAAYHSNGTDIWILSHEMGNNNFVAYLLTSQGLNSTPVVSAIGAIYDGMNRFGYMRVSPYCNRIATALGKQTEMNIPDTTAQVFDFDNTTGIVSNAIFIADLTNLESAYCCEFSPDNSKVYFTEHFGTGIYQVDLNDPNPASTFTDISSTLTSISNSSLTLGPDGKIYVTKAYSLNMGAINTPNLAGTLCNHVDNVLTLTGTGNSISTCNILKSCSPLSGQQENLHAGGELSIFPNPAFDIVTVHMPMHIFTSGIEKYNLRIMDVTGRKVYDNSFSNLSQNNEQVISTRSFSRGIYIVQVDAGKTTFIEKLVLE